MGWRLLDRAIGLVAEAAVGILFAADARRAARGR